MLIELRDLLPLPLEGMPTHPATLWCRTLQLAPGSYQLIMAPSGTGKSTFLNMVYGIRHDYRGTINLDGQPAGALSLKGWSRLRRDKLSYVFQDLRLFPQQTVWQNIQWKQQLQPGIVEEEIMHWMELLGIAVKRNVLAGKLSLGQQQRVAIIRALVQPFHWLLLDEPFSHLDEPNARLAASLILEICQRQQAGLLMTSLGQNDFFPFHQQLTL